MINKDALIRVGGFDEKIKSAQDYDVWLRLMMNDKKISYVDEALVVYHISGEQISFNPQNKIQGLELLNQKYKTYIEEDSLVHWHSLVRIIPYYSLAGQKKKAFLTLCQAVRIKPLKLKSNLKALIKILVNI